MKHSRSTGPSAPAHWNSHALQYERLWDRVTAQWGLDAVVLGHLGAERFPRVLDVACGTGGLSLAIASMGFDVTAVDFSSGMVQVLESKIALAKKLKPHLRIVARVADGQTLDGFPDESFDAVVSNFGVFMFPDRAAAWRSAMRVLKPGGRLLTTSWDHESVNLRLGRYVQERTGSVQGKPGSASLLDPSMNRTVNAATFEQELEEFGFVDVHVHTLSHPMCFSSGAEFVAGKSSDHQRAILDFIQQEISVADASLASHVSKQTRGLHPLWAESFSLQAIGHVAIATKPI